jgi:quercetin dioxygenase-like cupin family protein
MKLNAQGPSGQVKIVQSADVREVPIGGYTVDADQGWTKELISHAINGAPDLFVGLFRMEPGQFHPMHKHPNVGELYFILEGACEISVGEETRLVSAGTAIYTPRDTAHSIRTTNQGVRVLVVFPQGDWSKVEKTWVGARAEQQPLQNQPEGD